MEPRPLTSSILADLTIKTYKPLAMRLPASLLLLLPLIVTAGEQPNFQSEIRPILAENCFHCHGPDQKARKSKLRLDTLEGATRGGETGAAIVPGKPEESELVARIFSEDEDEQMPPRKAKRSLSLTQKNLLKDWIAAGAAYEEHWAWQKTERPTVPAVKASSLVRNPIDAFLLRRLEKEGLSYSQPTDSARLLRRLSLDLIGLPPTWQELREFEAVLDSPQGEERAYRSAVDRLLASPRFGERWARPWLDLARYADSNGFQADQLRPSWSFRDWVIRALNENMPFDQFTIEQLAGDLLPDATLEQKIATGFHRTVTCNVEAGVSPEGNRVNQVIDRVNTTATVWLGITMECAQCHDHKYDPFTMRDYYALFDFFNHTPLEVQLPSNKTDVSHDFIGPYLDLPLTAGQQQQAKDGDDQIVLLQKDRDATLKSQEEAYHAWERHHSESAEQQSDWEVLQVTKFTSTGGEQHDILKDGSVLLSGNVPNTTTYTVETRTALPRISQLKLEALATPKLPGKGPGRGEAQRPNFVLKEFTAALRKDDSDTPIKLHRPQANFSQKNWDVAGLIDGNPATGWAINPQFGKSHWATFELVKPIEQTSATTLVFTLPQDWGKGRVIGNLRLSARTQVSKDTQLPADLIAILRKPADTRNNAQQKKLRAHFEKENPTLKEIDAGIARLKKQRNTIKANQTLVMVEMKERRKTHILKRGHFLSPDAQVTANTPARLPKLENGAPGNRLDLARWLVRKDNPLTARVAVNRWWAELFGNGIVSTLEDFGTQSEPPTHPDLLDWLAVEFMDSGWDMKHVLKAIVLSQAYRQSSRLTPDLVEKDPRNLLLARAPRFRMDAERIRDNALAISGLLSSRMFGEPVMPYQPPGLWHQTGRNEPKWVEEKDEDRWRRGIYIVYRRAAPYPSMVNFDAPDRAACTVGRARTNTPSQALTLLNDPAFVEMALALADRILEESKSPGVRTRHGFRLALARLPSNREREIIDTLLHERLEHFQHNPGEADALLNNPHFTYKPSHRNRVQLAAWFYVANALLNLDETITRN